MAVMWWMPLRFIARATISREVHALRSAAERFARGSLAQALDGCALALAALAQALEAFAVEARLLGRELEQRRPERDLPRDPGDQPVELDHAAERRVAANLAVQLKATGLLERPRA